MSSKKPKPKIVVICGPTATGKSDYAVELAKKIDGEIISADSRQVYKGLDIGSGKITKSEMKNIPHYMLDVANPKRVFSASQFKEKAQKHIDTILSKNKVPIICGGTGFYIDTLLNLDLPEVPPNKKLRSILSQKSIEELLILLKQKDLHRYKTIDTKNKIRVIRALEIIDVLGKVPKAKKISRYTIEWIYIDRSNDILRQRIHDRLYSRIKKGMIREVKNLHENDLSYARLESLGLEYKYVSLYLQKKLTKKDMLIELENQIWHYAKRQRTWFKKNKELKKVTIN